MREQDFLKRLRATFRVEAEEHIHDLSMGIAELENLDEPIRQAEIVEEIFRNAHSLKGAARSVDLKDIEKICQPMESILAGIKNQETKMSPMLLNLLRRAVDSLSQMVSAMGEEDTSNSQLSFYELRRLLEQAASGGTTLNKTEMRQPVENQAIHVREAHSENSAVPVPKPESAAPPLIPQEQTSMAPVLQPVAPVQMRSAAEAAMMETVRIPIAKLDPLLLQAEEMIQTKLSAAQRAIELREILKELYAWKTESEQLKEKHGLHTLELPEWADLRLAAITNMVRVAGQSFEEDQRTLQRMVDDHLKAVKQILMLPVSVLVEVFPRLVRDIAGEQGKDVELVIRGTELEVDKRILEELKIPLIHLLRNCVDHGIEKPKERANLQKSEHSVITLAFSAIDSRNFEITVSDDGAGINVEQLRTAAIKKGIVTAQAAEKMIPEDVVQLIFKSGLSTTKIITDISGHGLGLAIVREKVEKLGGVVSVETYANTGTIFHLVLPLTMATFRGVLISEQEYLFILPLTNVERAVRIHRDEIKTVKNRETILFDGKILSLVKLSSVLGLPARREEHRERVPKEQSTADYISVLIISLQDNRIGFQVDKVQGQEEVLVKSLGKQLSRVRNISGAAVLGSGKVVLVINAADLMQSALHPGATDRLIPAEGSRTPTAPGRILVAEDSITSRVMLKNILETSGYHVATAVDGLDAFTQLRNGEFDLVVSDVDMPIMSGFELTAKIRSDKRLGELPVVLVTALESRQDCERGIEVGANAYIIKSS
ncbi:MAG TPA: response regulator, partial [Desulfuromonadaceae bacterium]